MPAAAPVILPRSWWTSRDPKGTTALDYGRVTHSVVHWPGSGSAAIGKHAGDQAAYDLAVQRALRGWQAYHMDAKGWRDIAYSVAVDQLGRIITLRGLSVWDGATKDWGGRSVSILAVLGNAEVPTDAMKAGIVAAQKLADGRKGSALVKAWHSKLISTTCPGPLLTAWAKAGFPLPTPPVVTPPPVEPPAPKTLSVKLMSTNARIDTAPDTGRFTWWARRAAYLALLKREAPSLILFQELNDAARAGRISMQDYIFGKLTHLAKSCPSKGNRPIGYDKSKWRLIAERAVELSPRNWAHLAHVEQSGFRFWLVNVHLSTDAATRLDQLAKLTRTLAGLPGAVVVAGDFNQPTVSLPGFRDAVKVAGKVTNRTARTLHGWRTQRYDGKHIDKVLIRDGDTTKISVRYLNVVLTSPNDETDHNMLTAGLALTATPSSL